MVEGSGFENRRTFTGTVGSNPISSADIAGKFVAAGRPGLFRCAFSGPFQLEDGACVALATASARPSDATDTPGAAIASRSAGPAVRTSDGRPIACWHAVSQALVQG